jgi:hypothetical protein
MLLYQAETIAELESDIHAAVEEEEELTRRINAEGQHEQVYYY